MHRLEIEAAGAVASFDRELVFAGCSEFAKVDTVGAEILNKLRRPADFPFVSREGEHQHISDFGKDVLHLVGPYSPRPK